MMGVLHENGTRYHLADLIRLRDSKFEIERQMKFVKHTQC